MNFQKKVFTTLGTLHDQHLVNPNYSLIHLLSALDQYRPDLVLTEAKPDHPSVEDATIEGGIEQSLIYAFCSINNIKIVPTDWFDEEFILLMEKESRMASEEFKKKVGPLLEKYHQSFTTSSIEELNSKNNKEFVSDIYSLQEQYGMTASRLRNEKIVENITKAIQVNSGVRVMAIYGMDHKYFIDNKIGQSLNLFELNEWFKPFDTEKFCISIKLKNLAISNLKSTEATLKNRIQNKYYDDSWGPKLKSKLARFPSWITAMEKICINN